MNDQKKTSQQPTKLLMDIGHSDWQCGTQVEPISDDRQPLNIVADVRIDSVSNQSIAAAPVIESLSLRMDNSIIEVRGSTSAKMGNVEAFSMGTWKGIAEVKSDGTFSNPNVPADYLLTGDSIKVRVTNSDTTSYPVVATDYFVHPRSIWILPTKTKAADQTYYQWWIQWADYQPTGYMLPAGETASIWLDGNDEEVWALVGIQGIAKKSDRTSQTENMRETRLKIGENILPIDPLGGVIHIRNNGNSGCRVILDSKIRPIPYYVLMQTPPLDFRRMLEKSDRLSEVQLVGDRVVISAYADTYEIFAHADVGEIVRSHEEVLRIEAQAAGLDGSTELHTRSNMWIHAVESTSSFYPHASTGYIGLPHSKDVNSEYMNALLGGLAHKLWVTLHEYGHHFQNRANSNTVFAENSVNIYALAVGRVHENNYADEFPKRWPPLRAWLSKPAAEKNYMESPDTQAIFEQLRKGFGENYLPRWDRYVRENPSPNNDLINFTASLSRVANANLAVFFAEWGVIKTNDQTWNALHALNLPSPPEGLTNQIPYT
ncbi:M60 family metallopeptidase [Pseudomonas sp. UMAB-08]|uniref:M60 family metallopeptidase n=1 Tax=Pseudomonas sp. UMAB-08 TaxID=1365375 RepID=UPI001C599035|nr:M60 family metallopeptidase [Pseudomonas sp. UMAB-08]